MIKKIKKQLYKIKESIKKINFKSGKYWEKRYSSWWDSWKWSYNEHAKYKSKILNNIIKDNNISTVIEFWCWDWNNLKYYNIKKYIGFDVSKTAIIKCKENYKNDENKSFIYYIPNLFKSGWLQSQLVISFEVIFHLIEDEIYYKYMADLFNSSSSYVLIFSTNKKNINMTSAHYKDRVFTKDIPNNFKLIKEFKTPQTKELKSLWSNFFLYKKDN